jgi:hypothetical protein
LILGTFNPTATPYVKKIYDDWLKKTLSPKFYYRPALPKDNPDVTKEQWESWANMDEETYGQMVDGKWIFALDGKRFAWAFDERKHVKSVQTEEGKKFMALDKRLPVHLCFDFNVDPITCTVIQHHGMLWMKVIKEYRLRTSDIFELLERIKTDFPDTYFIVNADASGRNKTAVTKGNRSYIDTIRIVLRLSRHQIQVPKSNPSIKNSRMLMNSLFSKHKGIWISDNCPFLIADLNRVKTNEKGEIEKDKDKKLTHLLDGLRYFMWYYFRKFVPLSAYVGQTEIEKQEDELDEAA